MKKTWLRMLLAGLCCGVAMLALLPGAVDWQTDRTATGEGAFSAFSAARYASGESGGAEPEYYGRFALSQESNATALLYAYDQIVAGIEASEESIDVYNETDAISTEELIAVFDAVRRDHTEIFWLGNQYSYRYNSSSVTALLPTYTMEGSVLVEARNAMENAVQEILNGISVEMSEFEREREIHDRLAQRIEYDMSAPNAHDCYGALVDGRAVCEGYAEAFQLLLRRVGIQSFIAIGSSANPSGGDPMGHAWNYVRIDGKYYHVDLTWDDQGERIFYAYFNKSTASISEDHTIDPAGYDLPTCDSEQADFYTVHEGKMGEFQTDGVAERLRAGGGEARVYVTGDVDAFLKEFRNHLSLLAERTGVSGGYRYGYSRIGRELILTLIPTVHSHQWATEWSSDGTFHWHRCIAVGCNLTEPEAMSGFGAHGDKNGDHLCDRCGKAISSHTGGTATCIERAVCLTCGESYGDLDAHQYRQEWSFSADGHWRECSVCGDRIEENGHTPGPAATEETPQICLICGFEIVPAKDHVHSFDRKNTDTVYLCNEATCTRKATFYYSCVCGLSGAETFESGDTAPHDFRAGWICDSHFHRHICAKCWAVCDEELHSYEWIVDREATVSVEGLRHEECTACWRKGKTETVKKATPEFIAGKNEKWNLDSNVELLFRFNAPIGDTSEILLDGRRLSAGDYEKREGDTVIVLNADFAKTLSPGTHALAVRTDEWQISTELTVRPVGSASASTPSGESKVPGTSSSSENKTETGTWKDLLKNTTVILVAVCAALFIGVIAIIIFKVRKK